MTEEEMDEYAEHATAGYDRWQKMLKGHAVSEEEFARFLMWKFNDLVRRRGKEWVKARLDKQRRRPCAHQRHDGDHR